MLVEEQLAVKLETQVSPVEIGFEKVLSSVWGIPQVNGRRIIAVRAIKNEILGLRVLEHQPNSNKKTKKDGISVLYVPYFCRGICVRNLQKYKSIVNRLMNHNRVKSQMHNND